jgi:hypothetical protein
MRPHQDEQGDHHMMTPATDDPFFLTLPDPATAPAPSQGTPPPEPAEQPPLLDLPEPAAGTGPRKARRDYLAIASLLYHPDITLTDLSHGQIPDSAYNPSAGPASGRSTRASRLTKAALLSATLPDARRISDHLRAARENAGHPTRATNGWLGYADAMLRVDGYNTFQVIAVIDWCTEQGWLDERVTNTFTLRRWIDRIISGETFRAWAHSRSITFTREQIAAAWTRDQDKTGPGPRSANRSAPPSRPAMPSGADTADWGDSRYIPV